MSHKVRVLVRPRKGILDPQGKAVQSSLERLGYTAVDQVRVGRMIEFDLAEKDETRARGQVDEMCKKLLSNPVIEDAQYELTSAGD